MGTQGDSTMALAVYETFGGGLNDKTVGAYVNDKGDNQALRFAESSQNMILGDEGIIKAHGFTKVNTDTVAGAPQGTFVYKGVHLAVWGGAIRRLNNDGTTTSLHTGLNATAPLQAVEWRQRLVLMNGVNPPLQFDGTTVSAITVVEDSSILWNDARPKGAAVFRNRIFYWGDPDNPDDLYTPRPETLANFEASDGTPDVFAVAPGHDGVITGVVPLTDDFLVIYKERAIYSLRGNAPFGTAGGEPFEINLITSEVGCIAPKSIVSVGQEHYFLSQVGLRKLSTTDKYGAVEPEQPQYLISETVETFAFDEAAIALATACYSPSQNSIFLSVPEKGKTTNSLTLVYNLVTGANTIRTGWTAAAMVFHKRQLFHQAYNGYVYRHDPEVFTYDGGAYPAEWESKWVAHMGLMTLKRYKKLSIQIDAGTAATLVFKWYVLNPDGSPSTNLQALAMNGGALWDSAIWDTSLWGDGGVQTFDVTDLGVGHAIKLVISCNRGGERVTIRQVDMEYDIISTRRG